MTRFACTIIAILTLILTSTTTLLASETTADEAQVKAREGFIFDKEAGPQYIKGDFKWTTWVFWHNAQKGVFCDLVPGFNRLYFGVFHDRTPR